MQHKAVYLLFCKFTVHVSGVSRTYRQEYTELLTTASGTGDIFFQLPPSNMAKLAWPRWREVAAQYRRLWLQFCVLLMIGVVDTRNM